MASAAQFANYLALPTKVPLWLWHVARAGTVCGAVGLAIAMVGGSHEALRLFWGAVIPALPALFFVAPGFWRNICPLAASNQAPRYLKLTRALTLPRRYFNVAQPLGIALFLVAV